MNLFRAMGLSANGLHAQRVAIDAISMNLANVQTTRTDEGGPYRRRQVVFSDSSMDQRFTEMFSKRIEMAGRPRTTHPNHFPRLDIPFGEDRKERSGVQSEMMEDPSGYQMVYDPSHPDADEGGYLYLPNINVIEEMVNLMKAVRSYEANVTAFNASKSMALKALEIGR